MHNVEQWGKDKLLVYTHQHARNSKPLCCMKGGGNRRVRAVWFSLCEMYWQAKLIVDDRNWIMVTLEGCIHETAQRGLGGVEYSVS